MFLTPRALKSLNSTLKIKPSNDNCKTTISCYRPINASDEIDPITFYLELSSLVRGILTHNVLIIGGDMHVQIGKDENSK